MKFQTIPLSRGEQVKETETQWPGSPAPAALSQLGLPLTLQPRCCCSSWGAPRSSARSRTARCRHSDSGCDLRQPLGKSSGWREREASGTAFPTRRKVREWTSSLTLGWELRLSSVFKGESGQAPSFPEVTSGGSRKHTVICTFSVY